MHDGWTCGITTVRFHVLQDRRRLRGHARAQQLCAASSPSSPTRLRSAESSPTSVFHPIHPAQPAAATQGVDVGAAPTSRGRRRSCRLGLPVPLGPGEFQAHGGLWVAQISRTPRAFAALAAQGDSRSEVGAHVHGAVAPWRGAVAFVVSAPSHEPSITIPVP
jgi:hypothetical protein